MNRKTFLTAGMAFLSLNLLADNKKKKKKKNNNNKKPDNKKELKLTGEIVLKEEGINQFYYLYGGKKYLISSAVEDKIMSYKDQKVTLYCTVYEDKIIVIDKVSQASNNNKNTSKNNQKKN